MMHDVDNPVTLNDLLLHGDWQVMLLLFVICMCVFALGIVIGHGTQGWREWRSLRSQLKAHDKARGMHYDHSTKRSEIIMREHKNGGSTP